MKDIRVQIKLKNNLILNKAEELWGKLNQAALAEKIGVSQAIIESYYKKIWPRR